MEQCRAAWNERVEAVKGSGDEKKKEHTASLQGEWSDSRTDRS